MICIASLIRNIHNIALFTTDQRREISVERYTKVLTIVTSGSFTTTEAILTIILINSSTRCRTVEIGENTEITTGLVEVGQLNVEIAINPDRSLNQTSPHIFLIEFGMQCTKPLMTSSTANIVCVSHHSACDRII